MYMPHKCAACRVLPRKRKIPRFQNHKRLWSLSCGQVAFAAI